MTSTRRQQQSHRHRAAGSVAAGCLSTVIGHPLDTIKVHLQANPNLSRKAGLVDVARVLAPGGGAVFPRLFRGIGPPMANQIVMNSVMFGVFDTVKEASGRSSILDENSSALVAGLFSGFATACISTPADWFKIQSQMSLSKRSENGERLGGRGLSSILRHAARKDGMSGPFYVIVRTVYRGHAANLGREGVFTMVYLGLYDRITRAVRARRDHRDEDHRHLDMGTVVAISSLTGACAWVCSYPFDTVKTVMQAAGHERVALGRAARSIYGAGGWRAFWRGAGPSTFRAMLVTSSRMLAYEKTIQMLGEMDSS